MTDQDILHLQGLHKRFGAVQALRGADLTVRLGEVHGLLGENGSGKSTIIKCLAGFHVPDAGALALRGQGVELPLRPGQARRLGVEFVHQDLGLLDGLSVAENLLMEEIAASRRSPLLHWRRSRRRVQGMLDAFGVHVQADRLIETLRPVEQAQVAIVRAVEGMRHVLAAYGLRGGLLVLDEPTVFLPDAEVQQLFAVIRQIADQGSGVLLVSHNLREIRTVTDRVTVLRDGATAGVRTTSEVGEPELVQLITGRPLPPARLAQTSRTERRAGDAAVVSGLSARVATKLTFEIGPGEIVGVTGLAGSGFEEVCPALFGALPRTSGSLQLGQTRRRLTSLTPARAIAAGLAYLPADRGRLGGIPSLSVTDNLTMPRLDEFTTVGYLNQRRMDQSARDAIGTFAVRAPDAGTQLANLSGGNQQKVLVAKWLRLHPQLLLLDEPTQGVDVGSRLEISAMLRSEAAERGTRILCASSDYEQLVAICDRVLVMVDGAIVTELAQPVDVPTIIQACYGQFAVSPQQTEAM